MNLRAYMEAIYGRLAPWKTEKLVYGDPVEVLDKSFIPVTRMVWKNYESERAQESSTESAERKYAEPAGFLEVTSTGARFIPIRKINKILLAVAVGFASGLTLGRVLHQNRKAR